MQFGSGPVEFRILEWTGRNRVRDRHQAGLRLRANIVETKASAPGVKQIVIAHSHGGNVALSALDQRAFNHQVPTVEAVICMATPFMSLTPAERPVRLLFPACVASVIWAVTVLVLAVMRAPVLMFAIGYGIVPMLVAPWLTRLHADHAPPERSDYLFKSFPPFLPAFILRSTRDEAALAIGLAQALQVVHTRLLRFFGKPPKSARFGLVLAAVASWAAMLLVAPPLRGLLVDVGPVRAGLILACLDPLPFSLLYLLAYVTLSFAAGFNNPRMWGSNQHIEVEPAPYGSTCEFKGYADVESIFADSAFAWPMLPGARPTPPGLRHAIYNISAVQYDIALLVADVQLGNRPTLLMRERFRSADERRAERGARKR